MKAEILSLSFHGSKAVFRGLHMEDADCSIIGVARRAAIVGQRPATVREFLPVLRITFIIFDARSFRLILEQV